MNLFNYIYNIPTNLYGIFITNTPEKCRHNTSEILSVKSKLKPISIQYNKPCYLEELQKSKFQLRHVEQTPKRLDELQYLLDRIRKSIM